MATTGTSSRLSARATLMPLPPASVSTSFGAMTVPELEDRNRERAVERGVESDGDDHETSPPRWCSVRVAYQRTLPYRAGCWRAPPPRRGEHAPPAGRRRRRELRRVALAARREAGPRPERRSPRPGGARSARAAPRSATRRAARRRVHTALEPRRRCGRRRQLQPAGTPPAPSAGTRGDPGFGPRAWASRAPPRRRSRRRARAPATWAQPGTVRVPGLAAEDPRARA